MNFFQHQDDARRSTRRLLLLFSLAVISILLITNIALLGSLWFFDSIILQNEKANLAGIRDFKNIFDYFSWFLVLKTCGTVIAVLGFIMFLKRGELAGGGKYIAERLGGKKIDLATHNPHERIILNVVEEMAIASGMPVPPVYLLAEKGINAFAAGFNISDAVIGISKGAIEILSRDQLQGVIAHEFSHIFNGDMRLNINLIAVLEGILFIGHTGWFVVRNFSGRSSRSNRNSGGAFILLGFVLIVLGFIGSFFGLLIKAAVSRQREFLADASAVQFTRNPEGLSGVLKLIGGSRYGARLSALHAEEMSHLFFANALTNRLNRGLVNYFSTHPPLEERICRIEPRWDGYYLKMTNEDNVNAENRVSKDSEKITRANEQDKADKLFQVLASGAILGNVIENKTLKNLPSTVDYVGAPDESNYAQAKISLQGIHTNFKEALKSCSSARALMYLMLLSHKKMILEKQLSYLKTNESKAISESLELLKASYENFPRNERLNLIELAIPVLKEQSKDEYSYFLKHLVFLIKADDQIDLFEWLLHSLLIHNLKPAYVKAKPIQAKYNDLSKLRNECTFLLSYLSYFSQLSENSSWQTIFDTGFKLLDLGRTQIVAQDQLKLDDLNNALQHFLHLYPLVKPKLLKACAACIQADGVVSIEQYELLRTLAALLDCPMPLMNISV